MSIAQTQPLVDSLVKAKIPKQTATNLIDFIEQNQSQELKENVELIKKDVNWLKKDNEIIKKDIHWLKWAINATLSLIIGLVGIMVYLHSDSVGRIEKLDTRIEKLDTRMDKLDTRMDKLDTRMEKLDTRMDRIENKLDLILKRK